MARTDDRHRKLTTLAVMAAVVAVFYVASEVILPIALATLLTFLLSPLATRLERVGLGRVPSVLAVTALTFVLLGGIGWVVVDQGIALTAELPKLKTNLIERIERLRGLAERGPGETGESGESGTEQPGETDAEETSESLTETINKLAAGVTGEETTAEGTPIVAGREPIPVQIVSTGPVALEFLADWLGPVLGPLGTAAIVFVFVIFMLIQRDDLRDRFIRLSGTGRLATTTQALDEAGERVSRYLLMLVIINGSYGLIVWIGLWLIGLPNPFLWGLLAATMRFVPYVGPWIAAATPILLSLAVDASGWTTPILTIGLFVVLELFSNNVMEPWLYGHSLGISVFGIIVMASFWTWLWGPIGLVLSMPLTVCLVVLGRYAPQLEWLNILLGDAPALELREKYYQRLLALDYYESGEIVAEALKHGSVEQLYTDVLMPALSLAERDRHSGELAESQRQFAYQTIRETIEELGERARRPEEAAVEGTNPRTVRIWCVPAEDDADEIAGTMLSQMLTAHGYTAEAVPADAVDATLLEQVAETATDAVLISAVAPGGVIHARRLCLKLHPKREHLVILVGLWNATGPFDQVDARLKSAGADAVVTKLEEALRLIEPKTAPDRPPQPEQFELAGTTR